MLWLVGCRGDLPLIQDAYEIVTLTPLPTATVLAPTPDPGEASQTGLTFFKTWEAGDYAGMYTLLSPQSQALVDRQAFIDRYTSAEQTAVVQAVRTQPLAARQEGLEAEFRVRVTWESPILGNIVRDHTARLVYQDNRWGIVWDEGLILPELAGGNRLQLNLRVPSRANIYDSDGGALAYQGTAITLGVVPGQISDEAGLLNAISPLLGKTPAELQEMYVAAQPDWYVPLGDITGEAMQEHILELQPFLSAGLTANDRRSRLYPENGVAPHLVGFTGPIPAEQLDDYLAQGYEVDDKVGLAGIEAWGERYLSGGRGGTLRLVGPSGEDLGVVQETEPRQARSIYTTIRKDFQLGVEQALADAVQTYPGGTAGAVVVLDVNTGAVLAAASYPTYNPAIFDAVRLDAGTSLTQVLNDPGQPLLNRAMQGQYPLGSVFKLVTMSAGLLSGSYTFESRYTSTGTWTRLGDEYTKADLKTGGHGNISYRTAIIQSCNSCFYDMGYELDGIDPNLLPNTAMQFGLGAATGIEGLTPGGEAPGLIPSPAWKLATLGDGWATGDAVNMAIGQGFVLVTPLQTATMMAAIANGGTLYQPTLISRIGAGGGAPEETWAARTLGQLPLSPQQLAGLQEALRAVTTAPDGTATHRFAGLGVPVAGKTGTAEAPPGNAHAWFVGYAPAAPYTLADGSVIAAPQIAVAVIMEHAGEGSVVSAPIFRRVIELYYNITPPAPYPW